MSRDNPDLSYALGLSPNDAAAYLDSLGVRPTTRRLGKKPESSEGHLVSQEVVVNPKAPKNEQKTVEQWGYRPIENGAISWASPGFAWSPGYATWGVDHVLAQKMDYLKNERLYTEVVQAINDSEARHQAFALWIAQALRSHARGDAAVLGLVQPEVIKKREKNAMKKIGRYDGVITAYRKERMALMDTRKERLK